MNVQTKRVKRIVRAADLRRPAIGGDGAMIAVRDDEPDISVLYVAEQYAWPLIITVLWRTESDYIRVPGGFIPVMKVESSI